MAQPHSRRSPADGIALLVQDLEELERRMRLGPTSQRAHDNNEEEALRIANAIRAVFRGILAPAPSAPPLHVEQIGTRCRAWF